MFPSAACHTREIWFLTCIHSPIRLFRPRHGSTGPHLMASARLASTHPGDRPAALMGSPSYLAETRKCNGWGSVAMPTTGQELAVRGSGSPSHILLSSRMRRN